MFDQLKEGFDGVVFGVGEIVVGVLLLLNPVRFTSGIVIALGTVLCVLGGISFVRYFMMEPRQAAVRQLLSKGLFLMGAGGVCILRSDWLTATVPVLTVFYGMALLAAAIIKVQRMVDMLRLKRKAWLYAAISAGTAFAAAALLLLNPFESALLLWMTVGASLIVQAVCDLLAVFAKKKPEKAA